MAESRKSFRSVVQSLAANFFVTTAVERLGPKLMSVGCSRAGMKEEEPCTMMVQTPYTLRGKAASKELQGVG
eukprot:1140769-Pelagomonas_calceolata.AAC.5